MIVTKHWWVRFRKDKRPQEYGFVFLIRKWKGIGVCITIMIWKYYVIVEFHPYKDLRDRVNRWRSFTA